MPRSRCARLAAGAFLLFGLSRFADGERLLIAVMRGLDSCPSGDGASGVTIRVVPLESSRRGTPYVPPPAPGCIVLFQATLADTDLPVSSSILNALAGARGVVLQFDGALARAEPGWEERLPYTIKTLSSAARAGSPEAMVAVQLPATGAEKDSAFARIVTSEELRPYVDAVLVGPGTRPPDSLEQRLWVLTQPTPGAAVASVLGAIAEHPTATLVAVVGSENGLPGDEEARALDRLAALLHDQVSRDPTPTAALRADGSPVAVVRFFDAKTFSPLLVLAGDPSGSVRIELTGGPFEKAAVENLASGARRDFPLAGAKAMTLDLSNGPLVVALTPAARKGGDTKAAVEVGATRGLTAEEIVARERAWESGQRDRVASYVAAVNTSLRFRVADFPDSIQLTIRGSYFYRRGQPTDWVWEEFFLNGVRWKARTIPKLPILQPEKVTTLPLDIRLTEDYSYELAGETQIEGRRAWRVEFRPRETVGDRPAYRGTAWIDQETFALLRRESIQLNLKGDTLSNVQTEYYREVPGHPGVVLPLIIRGDQVFSTAGRTTAIERYVTMDRVEIDPPDFEARLQAAYASKAQMVRDTDEGLRYLVPDPAAPEKRVVEDKLSRKSLFGLVGAFYQRSSDYPLPLLGVQYFDFNLFEKSKQLSVFFGGVLLFANYTDPSVGGSRFDLGADIFAVALPFTEQAYRDGEEIVAEQIKHLPEFFQVNVGHPFGPYLKTSLGIFTQYDGYKPTDDTSPTFVVPVDTFTFGAELRLAWNQEGYNVTARGAYLSRAKWEPWGEPDNPGYSPNQKDYWKYSVDAGKTFYFPGFRQFRVGLSWLDGEDLDRFSQWDFGPFGNTRLAGFPSGSVRADRAYLANLAYGLNFQELVRFEVRYDQALVTEPLQGYDNTYFSGVGLLVSTNGPWDRTRIRLETGYPVVARGVKGFTINVQLLKIY